jgi:hypothetical protein
MRRITGPLSNDLENAIYNSIIDSGGYKFLAEEPMTLIAMQLGDRLKEYGYRRKSGPMTIETQEVSKIGENINGKQRKQK